MRSAAVVVAIAILILIAYAQVAGHSFINLDDGQFIFENAQVKQGLTAGSIRWAFTSGEIGYYPLTWVSHMLDVELFELNAGRHLFTGVILHLLSSVVLFFALHRMTGAPVESAFVALLFAMHPTRVESVAWAAERKDTLSTLFGVLALLLYARAGRWRIATATIALAASLLSKQMLVTLPFVFLLLDWWPLRRFSRAAVVEKIPMFIVSAIGIWVAMAGQKNLNAVVSTSVLPLSERIANALLAYVRYLGLLFWPADLAPVYPYEPVSAGTAAMCALVLVAITAAAWLARLRAPSFLTGWLWYLGTLVPVIGIVQIGSQSMADRYTYFPFIGLFIAIVWAVAAAARRTSRVVMAGAGVAIVLLLTFLTYRQVSLWRDTRTLFTHTLAVTGPNVIAEYALGQSLQLSHPEAAIPHLQRAIELARASTPLPPLYAQSQMALGNALLMQARSAPDVHARKGLLDRAQSAYREALRVEPANAAAQRNLALAASMQPPPPAPATPVTDPNIEKRVDELVDSALTMSAQGQLNGAITRLREAVSIAPRSVEARVYLALHLANAGRNAQAAQELREAEKIDAVRANRYVTGALQLPPSADNLTTLIRRYEQE